MRRGLTAKERAIAEVEDAYRDVAPWLRSLSPADLERRVWTGEGDGWRVRDLVPHFALWQRLAAKAARLIAAGTEPPAEGEFQLRPFVGVTDGTDDLNQRQFAEWRDREPAACFAELDAAHTLLVAALRALPEARVVKSDGGMYRYFWQPGLNHLRQHREHIEQALKETTE